MKIIFITSHVEYAIDAFELPIFRYIPKDDIEKRLHAAIRDAIKLIELEDGKAYTIIATIGTSAIMNSVNWIAVVSASALAGVLSLLTSVAGLPEVSE